MNLVRRTGKNIAWTAISEVIVKSVTVGITIYLARVLGVNSFGIFSLAVAIASSIWPVVDLGVTGFGTRSVARNPKHAQYLLRSLNSMRFFAALTLTLVSLGCVYVLPISDLERWTILSAMLYLVGYAICPDWTIRGLERMSWLGLINGATVLALLLGVGLFVRDSNDVIAASAIRSVSFGIGSIVGLMVLSSQCRIRFRLSIDLLSWRQAMLESHRFLFNRVATNLGQFIPLFAITIYMTDSDIGLFAAPHRLYIIALTGLAAITAAVYPVLSGLYHRDRSRFLGYQQEFVRLLLLLFVPISGVGIISSGPLIGEIFGVEYLVAARPFAVMLVTLTLVALRAAYSLTLMAAGLEKYTVTAMLIALVGQLLAVSVLMPYFGIMGAAFAMLCGEIMAMAILVYVSVVRLDAYRPFDRFLVILFVLVGSLMTVVKLCKWELTEIVLICAPMYLISVFLLRLVRINHVRMLFEK